MAEREQQEQLQELFDKGIPVYSYSKIECMNNCLYEAYRTYIMHDKENQLQNVYSQLGGSTHDCLEAITHGEATEADLLPTIERDLAELDLLGIEFPKGRDGSDSIRQGWIADMTHFCKTYKAPKGNFETEQFFLYKTPQGNYLQGYIDLIKHRDDGTVSIYDYKTSSLYKGEDVKKHGRQLLLYALGLIQQGYQVQSVAWIFLKYANVSYMGRKTVKSTRDTDISKVIERKNIIKELEPVIIKKLESLGFDEMDIDLKMIEARETNTIPEEVADQFVITPYVMKWDISAQSLNEANKYFDMSIAQWEVLGGDEYFYPPRKFTRITKNNKEVDDTFYCSQLCGYRHICPHLKEFLEKREYNNSEDSLF